LIDFRYHLVSIVAVFLALTVGIVVGATAFRPSVENALNHAARQAIRQDQAANARNAKLQSQINADNVFGRAISGYALAHLLSGERVVLVTEPNADGGTVTGISNAVHQAGATITGTVSLTPQFFATSRASESALSSLASQVTPIGVPLPGPAPTGSNAGQQAAARVLAAGLMTKDGPVTVGSGQSQAILTGFSQQGFLQLSGSAHGPVPLAGQATMAVVVEPAGVPTPAGQANSDGQALVWMTHDLQQAGLSAVLVGSVSGSGPGSAIDLVTSGNAPVVVSTVDDADTAIGQILVIEALRHELDPHAAPGNYGVGTQTAPSPAPTSSPTPSTSPSPPPRKKGRR
jgi:hypothetical protein